jgi:nicotinate dehydrogenase subunit B
VSRAALFWLGAVLLLAACATAIAPIAPPQPASFSDAAKARGRTLAMLGNCVECHTRPGSAQLAGGRAIETPFGTIYSSNLTPDAESGIGGWPREAFRRALRQGLGRDGRRLYPAFPYDHFTKLVDADIDALYAYLMSGPAVAAMTPEPKLRFPYNMRPLLAVWQALYVTTGPMSDADHGRYLAEAVAHCGACHTPRDGLGGEIASRPYAGGESDGWSAPPLGPNALGPWTAAAMELYLSRGWDEVHGLAAGPMMPVAKAMQQADPADVKALAAYVAGLSDKVPPPPPIVASPRKPIVHTEGAALYEAQCVSCHRLRGDEVDFAGFTLLRIDSPANLLHWLLEGLEGPAGATMPGFAKTLDDRQITEIAAFLREDVARYPAWKNLDVASKRLR